MTHDWKPYEHFVPPEKHIQLKAETFTVEGCNRWKAAIACSDIFWPASVGKRMLQQKRIHAEVFRHAFDG